MFGLQSYFMIGTAVVIVLLIGAIYFLNLQVEGAKSDAALAKANLAVVEEIVKDQGVLIDDMLLQNSIIIQNFNRLQERTSEIERRSIDRSRETEEIVRDFNFEGSQEIAERMNRNIQKLLRELEAITSGRRRF
jgi:hypothetical protein